MAAQETEVINQEIEAFKVEHRGGYADYYIGITKHIEQRLVENNASIIEHLQKGEYTTGNPTYSAECKNRDSAVEIERCFQEKGMLKLNPRSFGVEESKYIYCYKMTEENKKAVLTEGSSEGKRMREYIKPFRQFENKKDRL